MTTLTPTIVEIDLKALKKNWAYLISRIPKGQKGLAVVKSNAYGHGAAGVVRALQEAGAEWFGVGTIVEAIDVRKAGVKENILILLGIVDGGADDLLKYDLKPVVYDIEVAKRLNEELKKRKAEVSIHVKIDTGMSRLGVVPGEVAKFFEGIKKLSSLKVEGMLSHLAQATNEDFTKFQIENYWKIVKLAEEAGVRPKFHHIANSALGAKRAPDGFHFIRFGIVMYANPGINPGINPGTRNKYMSPDLPPDLQPVMSWKTRIISLKYVPAETYVSYERTFKTKHKSRLAVIPVGYADGYPLRFSNRAHVLVREKKVPIAGRVCMDMSVIDVTGLPDVKVGDEVVLLGRQGDLKITVEELAEWGETIPYEILTGVATRVPRIYLG